MTVKLWNVVFDWGERELVVSASNVGAAMRRACEKAKAENLEELKAHKTEFKNWAQSPNSITKVELLAEED